MKTDPRVDTYIAKSPPFAQPILTHLRKLVRKAAPQTEETIKWGRPFYVVDGTILCNISAFKQHCTMGIWNKSVSDQVRGGGTDTSEAMGSFGRITSLKDLPADKQLLQYLQQAANDIGAGYKPMARTAPRQPKPEIPVPEPFAAALKMNKQAAVTFDSFPPSHRREYLEWITEAKRDDTRDKRIATAIEWLSEGKSRNWKYEK
jgi:uncharacterized protein YdeI (YjbR/CyaY-like superfamily)